MRHLNPIIEQKTGITEQEAFAIDDTNLYEKLGETVFKTLSRNFYTRVYNDEQTWFRNIFKNKDFEEAIANQHDFFMQRMGGPPLFSERKGHPALIARHMNFNMSEKSAERWLFHMNAAVSETDGIDTETAALMMKYFTHTAWFLSLGVSQAKQK